MCHSTGFQRDPSDFLNGGMVDRDSGPDAIVEAAHHPVSRGDLDLGVALICEKRRPGYARGTGRQY